MLLLLFRYSRYQYLVNFVKILGGAQKICGIIFNVEESSPQTLYGINTARYHSAEIRNEECPELIIYVYT